MFSNTNTLCYFVKEDERILRAHVFIVNEETFPVHLQYLFAGTGAKEKDEDIPLLCDIKRVRAGDLVLFYIEATKNKAGGFYGIFRVADENPLVFHTPGNLGYQIGSELLNKKLIYRILIEPYEVYSEGIPEWEALDKLPIYATEIQWSLIYRKLKGKRGCTPLFPWEAEKLIEMIRCKNNGLNITYNSSGCLRWENGKIILDPSIPFIKYPDERKFEFDVIGKIIELMKRKRAYESYLQLYFSENAGKISEISPIVGENIVWIGNEVHCGVGMQKIDIMTICETKNKKEFRIIELKDEPVNEDITEQIGYYVSWGSQDIGRHLWGAHHWNIQPIIVAPPHTNRNWNKVVRAFNNYNDKCLSMPLLYFEFIVDTNARTLHFTQVNY